jgi:hypothetical protein
LIVIRVYGYPAIIQIQDFSVFIPKLVTAERRCLINWAS